MSVSVYCVNKTIARDKPLPMRTPLLFTIISPFALHILYYTHIHTQHFLQVTPMAKDSGFNPTFLVIFYQPRRHRHTYTQKTSFFLILIKIKKTSTQPRSISPSYRLQMLCVCCSITCVTCSYFKS